MLLLNPHHPDRYYPDQRHGKSCSKQSPSSKAKALRKIKEDDLARTWYGDFLEFQKQEKLFATLLTPSAYGFDANCRWDTWRNCEFNEILGFYGLAYWYTWQVSILGFGPIWMSSNEATETKSCRIAARRKCFCLRSVGAQTWRGYLLNRNAA